MKIEHSSVQWPTADKWTLKRRQFWTQVFVLIKYYYCRWGTLLQHVAALTDDLTHVILWCATEKCLYIQRVVFCCFSEKAVDPVVYGLVAVLGLCFVLICYLISLICRDRKHKHDKGISSVRSKWSYFYIICAFSREPRLWDL